MPEERNPETELQDVVDYLTTLLVGQSSAVGWHVVPPNIGTVLLLLINEEVTTELAKQMLTDAVVNHYNGWLAQQDPALD